MTRVMVVEDQAMPRQLFEMLIQNSGRYELACSIENAAMADVYVKAHNVELVLMDVCTAFGESGLEAAARIKKRTPDVKVIIVTSMPECSYIDRARMSGVDSFWYKDASEFEILDVMDRTMEGENVYPDGTPVIKIGLCTSEDFTPKELQILRELTSGDKDESIAARLNMSVWTVRSHVKHMLEKTGFESRTRLAVAARESGLVILGY